MELRQQTGRHSGSDGQDLPLEASNSNCFSPLVSETWGRSASAEPKCCCKSDLSPRTGCPCFLIYLTPPILLPNVAAICQQFQKLLDWHLSPFHPRRKSREEGWGVSMRCPGEQRPQSRGSLGAARNDPTQLIWQEHRREGALKKSDRNESRKDDKEPEKTPNQPIRKFLMLRFRKRTRRPARTM